MIVDGGDGGDWGDWGDEETGRRGDGETGRRGDWGDEETGRMCSLINYSTANLQFRLFQG